MQLPHADRHHRRDGEQQNQYRLSFQSLSPPDDDARVRWRHFVNPDNACPIG
jgi:hypothetical protein